MPETRESREPLASVSTEAETPMAAELIAAARPERVLSEEPMVRVWAVPEPTWMESEPESVSFELVMALR